MSEWLTDLDGVLLVVLKQTFLGQRYGEPTLPSTIDADEMDVIMTAVTADLLVSRRSPLSRIPLSRIPLSRILLSRITLSQITLSGIIRWRGGRHRRLTGKLSAGNVSGFNVPKA